MDRWILLIELMLALLMPLAILCLCLRGVRAMDRGPADRDP